MDIYLACTVRGDRGGLIAARALADRLERGGHTITTGHLLADDVDTAESALTEREVFERDVRWLNTADLLIAEASGSSYGVGFEVGYVLGRAERTGQRVLLVYDATRGGSVSRLISGNTHPSCTTYPYRDAADLVRFVDVFLAPVPGSGEAGDRRASIFARGLDIMKPVRIRRLQPKAALPRYESDGAAAFDFAASEDVTIDPGEVALVRTGLVIDVPVGMFLAIFARSSTPLRRGLMVANGVGVVDSDYCGPGDEVKIAVLNFTKAAVRVTAGDRLAQGILLPAARVTWEETGVVGKVSRGGFGSTG